jgi:hypothetical protein
MFGWFNGIFGKSKAERAQDDRAAMEFSALPPAPLGMRWCYGLNNEWALVPIEAPISAHDSHARNLVRGGYSAPEGGTKPAAPKSGSGVGRLSADPKPMKDLRRELRKRLGDTPKRKSKSKRAKAKRKARV